METRKLRLNKKKIIGFKRRELNINDCWFSPQSNCDSCNDQTKSWYIAAIRHNEYTSIVQDVELPLVETDDELWPQQPMDVEEASIQETDKPICDSTSTQSLDNSLIEISEPVTGMSSSNSSAGSQKTPVAPSPYTADTNADNCIILDDEDEDMNQTFSETVPKPTNQELHKNKRLNEIIRKCIVQTNNKENKTPRRTSLTINAVPKEIRRDGDTNIESPRFISTPLLTKIISDDDELLTIQSKPSNKSDAEALIQEIPTITEISDKIESNNIDSECILIDDDDNENADTNQEIPQQEIPTPKRRITTEISDKIENTTVQPKASNNIDSQCILIDDDDNNDNVCANQEISTSSKSSNTFELTSSNISISHSSPMECTLNQPKLVEYVIRHDNDLIEDENDLTLAELQEKNQKESSTTKTKENEIPCIDLASDEDDVETTPNEIQKKLNNSDGFIDEVDPNNHYDDFWSSWNNQQINDTNNVIKETTTATSHIKNLESLQKIGGIKDLVFTIEPDNRNASNDNTHSSNNHNDHEISQLNVVSTIDPILQLMPTIDDEIVIAQPQFQCQVCYEVFEKNCKLQKHLRTSEQCIEIINKTTETYINTKPYECDVCNRTFSDLSVLEYHMLRAHSGSLKRKCRFCGKMFPTPKSLRRHAKTHVNKKDKFKCTECGRCLATKQSLLLHMRVHSGEKPHKCQTCTKAFTTTYALASHLRTHTNERPYKCDICHNSFAYYGSLQAHKYTHNKPFSCEFCSKSFPQKNLLNIHITNHHSADGKLYQCDICHKGLRSYMSLKHHMLRHSNPVTCKICLKTYSSESNLEGHMNRTHNKNDLNQNGTSINDWMTCEVCNTLLPNVDSMRSHMNLHRHNDIDNDIDVKPFKCRLCIMVFSLESNLQRHMALHKRKQGRPVLLRKCNKCNESFRMSQKQFKLHLKSHLATTVDTETDNNIDTDIDVKPFKCKFCEMVFSLETNLKRHMALHKRKQGRPALLRKCDDCNDSFLMSQKEFVLHKKTQHSSTPFSIIEKTHKCKICKRSFADSNKLIYHQYAHTPKTKDNRYKCDKCNKTVTSIFQLRQHMLCKHTSESRYECKYCKNRFRQYVQMYNHIRRTHKNIIKTYSCKICEKSYTKIESLYIHNQTHKIITDSIKCKFCDYEFKDDKQLAKHAIIHAKDKNRPYLCTVCDKTFEKLSDLNSHSHLHTDSIRKFKCIICEKLFANDGALANHQKLHTRNTTFECDRCQKTFNTKFGYNNHMLRHNRRRRRGHKCDLCLKSFWTKMSLTSHKRRHADNDTPQLEKLECPVCLKTFRTQKALDQHLHRHVGVK